METNTVTVRRVRALSGPNLFAYVSVLQVTLDIGPYENQSSDTFPGFVERLVTWLPELPKHECSPGRPGGFIERLQRGTYLAHIVEHVTLELQGIMGFKVSFGRARGTGERGVYNVVIQYREEEPARAAFDTALRLTLAAMHDTPFELQAELDHLLDVADEYRFGPSTGAIVEAARRRDIPVLRLTPTSSLVQLGYGVHQKRILASETSSTSSIAVDTCQDKTLTNQLLRTLGVPVPDGQTVASADGAWGAAQDIGLPVVVKPRDGNQGKGVSINLSNEADVRQAYDIAAEYGRPLVERYIPGDDYRLLVVNGRLVAAARREPAHVVGDGRHTISELVYLVNQDPRRRPGHSSTLTRIRLDDAARLVLHQQELSADDVPKAGRVVRLRHNSNLSTGGTASDVTDEVHPHNVQMAELAAQIIALDVAGIDVVCRDIGRPLHEQGGAIIEVNAAPGLRMHLCPAAGRPRDVGAPIVDMLYPNGAPARIPIIAFTGTNGKTTVTRLIAHIFDTARSVVGMTVTGGIYIGHERIMIGDCSGPRSARAVLLHPGVEVAVLETARGGILRGGLGFDRCLVGVVTNVSADHLGLGGIDTLEGLTRVKQVVVESVARDGATVLNADDPLVAQMAAASDAPVIYFGRCADNPSIVAHLAAGGRAVCVNERNAVILATKGTRIELINLDSVPCTLEGQLGFQVQNVLAAVAAAWGAGMNPAFTARALTTFRSDSQMAPGRFNVMEFGDVEVVLDYAHNPAAMAALMEATAVLGQRRTVLVCGLPGDRSDEALAATIAATIGHVDAYVLYDLDDRRGRAVNETPKVMWATLPPGTPCEITTSESASIVRGWQQVGPGDRLIITPDLFEQAIALLHDLARCSADEPQCDAPLMRMPAMEMA